MCFYYNIILMRWLNEIKNDLESYKEKAMCSYEKNNVIATSFCNLQKQADFRFWVAFLSYS